MSSLVEINKNEDATTKERKNDFYNLFGIVSLFSDVKPLEGQGTIPKEGKSGTWQGPMFMMPYMTVPCMPMNYMPIPCTPMYGPMQPMPFNFSSDPGPSNTSN